MSQVLIVSHDAGGAEIISAWVKRHTENDYRFLIDGPARRIFEKKLGIIEVLPPDRGSATLDTVDWVLSGTSWSNNLEHLFYREAKQRGVRVVAYLDHWSRYPERFRYQGTEVLPDEVWVGDTHALAVASGCFPPALVMKLEPNLYFEEMIEKVAKYAEPKGERKGIRILYVTEPIASTRHTGIDPGYHEFEAIEGFMEYLEPKRAEVEKVRIRSHPAELAGKYLPVIEKHGSTFDMELSPGTDLAQDCAWSDWVVGCDTTAMAVGVLAKRRVLCSIPVHGEPLALPFPEIEKLFLR